MSQPFVGQVIMFGGNFAPAGWMMCSGQIIPISENDVLFQLIGTTYGGDGQSTFALPDLRGRVPVHQGQGAGLSNYVIGQASGAESVTLNTNQIPQHNHMMLTTAQTATAATPSTGTIMANENVSNGSNNPYTYAPYNAGTPAQQPLSGASIAQTGGNQPHNNIQPVLTVTYCISLFGIFPSQN